MKGIAHFATGAALATFFPAVVQAGAEGSLIPVLGAIGGILPDTLDFRFARYFEAYDLEIDPGPEPDAAAMAEALAEAMRRAYTSGRDQAVMVHSVRLGVDLWRSYALRFDPEAGEVCMHVGPLVNTGGVIYPGSEPEVGAEARCEVGVPLESTYSAAYEVAGFSGPSFRFAREGDRLAVHFLDWHRRWSHSLVVAAGLGLLCGLLWGPWAGLVAGLGAAAHILEDQLGHMGSNLFWPFTRGRVPGLGLLHSGDALPNFLTVWTSVALILFNLDRFSAHPWLPYPGFLLGAVGLPWGLTALAWLWHRFAHREKIDKAALREGDLVADAERPTS